MAEQIKERNGIKRGDWVRFMSAGRFVIGEVRYIMRRTGGFVDFYTDAGVCGEDSILESR